MASICSAVYCNDRNFAFRLPNPCSAATLPPNTLEITLALAMTVLVAGALALLAGSLTRRLLRSIEGDRRRLIRCRPNPLQGLRQA